MARQFFWYLLKHKILKIILKYLKYEGIYIWDCYNVFSSKEQGQSVFPGGRYAFWKPVSSKDGLLLNHSTTDSYRYTKAYREWCIYFFHVLRRIFSINKKNNYNNLYQNVFAYFVLNVNHMQTKNNLSSFFNAFDFYYYF